jgi:protein SCO1/2
MRQYSYIAVAFIVLVFGIIFIPRIISRFQEASLVDNNRLSAPNL